MAEGHAIQNLHEIQDALKQTKHLFNISDALLYTPNIEDINDCTYKLFDCFLMEMNVLLHEELPENTHQLLIEANLNSIKCKKTYYCEQELTKPMVFYERMTTFLQKLMSLCQGNRKATCD